MDTLHVVHSKMPPKPIPLWKKALMALFVLLAMAVLVQFGLWIL